MKKFLKDNYVYAIFCLVVMIVNVFYINSIFSIDEKLCENNTILMAQLIVFLIELVFCVLVRILVKKKFHIENIFLTMAIPLGLLFLVGIPMGANPDEYNHFARVYEISSGHIISKVNENNDSGRELPVELIEHAVNTSNLTYTEAYNQTQNPNSGNTAFYGFYNTALYNFISYLPIIPGVALGRALDLPVTLTGYIGKLCNLISWIVLLYFAIKKLPFFKEFLLFIALLPITIAEATAITADGFTFAMSAFYISYILHLIYTRKDKINWKDNLILILSTIIISLCKIIYLPLCLLLLLIPDDRYTSKKKKYIINIITILVAIVINLIWLKIASRFLVKLNPGVNSHDQLAFILSNPFTYLQNVFNAISLYGEGYMLSMFGKNIAGTPNTSTIYIIACLCIFVNLVLKTKENKSTYFQKIVAILIIIAIVGLMFTSLYLQWTPVANRTVEGVQGRYFLPWILLVPFIFFGIKTKNKDNEEKTEEVKKQETSIDVIKTNKFNLDYLTIFMVLYNIYMCLELFSKFI